MTFSFPPNNTKPEVILHIANDTIVSIKLKRPGFSKAQKNAYKGLEKCHRVGLPIIKQEIRNSYVGRSVKKQDIPSIGRRIQQDWRSAFRKDDNIFAGDPEHNNFAGKLCLLLQKLFVKGEKNFSEELQKSTKNPPCVVIQIPMNEQFANDVDGYSIVREQLGTNTIELTSWNELCDWFFAANYDESERPKPKLEPGQAKLDMFFGQSKTVKGRAPISIRPQKSACCQAMSRFMSAFHIEQIEEIHPTPSKRARKE